MVLLAAFGARALRNPVALLLHPRPSSAVASAPREVT
jgi:hypothetical protein